MRDSGLDDLLALNGVVLVIDPIGRHWVKFVVKRVEPSDERPHGLSYSLTLHGSDGERLATFDNAHPVASGGGRSRRATMRHDHEHGRGAPKPYEYHDAATLLRDFWQAVDAMLKQKGAIP
jgi:hypothetical protein